MARRCLISYVDRYPYLVATSPDVPVPALSATGTPVAGFKPAKALEARRSTWWEVPTGGPHTLTLAYATAYEFSDVVAIFAPPGRDFLTAPRVRLRNAAGTTVFDSSTSFRPPRGLPDQRFFVMPSRTQWRYLDVILGSGDALAYVRYGWAMDLTRFAGRLVELSPNDSVVIQEGASSAVFAAPDLTSGRRYLSYRLPLLGVPMATIERDVQESSTPQLGALFDMWDRIGKANTALVLPYAEDNTADPVSISLMHATSLCGRLNKDLEFSFEGRATNTEDEAGNPLTDQVLRNVSLSFEGAF